MITCIFVSLLRRSKKPHKTNRFELFHLFLAGLTPNIVVPTRTLVAPNSIWKNKNIAFTYYALYYTIFYSLNLLANGKNWLHLTTPSYYNIGGVQAQFGLSGSGKTLQCVTGAEEGFEQRVT